MRSRQFSPPGLGWAGVGYNLPWCDHIASLVFSIYICLKLSFHHKRGSRPGAGLTGSSYIIVWTLQGSVISNNSVFTKFTEADYQHFYTAENKLQCDHKIICWFIWDIEWFFSW